MNRAINRLWLSAREHRGLSLVLAIIALAGVVAVGMAVPVGGHGRPSAASAPEGAKPGQESESEAIDWNAPPFTDGLPVASAAAAAPVLHFAPVAPRALGVAQQMVVHNPHVARSQQGFGLAYTSPTYGRFFAVEQPTAMSEAHLLGLAASCDPNMGCQGQWSVKLLSNGVQALVVDGPTVTSVTWMHGGTEFIVMGPAGTFDESAALTVAGEFAMDAL